MLRSIGKQFTECVRSVQLVMQLERRQPTKNDAYSAVPSPQKEKFSL